MTQDRKAVKAKFFFDNGDEVTVLTKNERERDCMTAIARATMCKREREGDMEEVIAIVRRSIRTRECTAATANMLLSTAVRLVESVLDEVDEDMKPKVISLVMEKLAELAGAQVIRGNISVGLKKDEMLEALSMVTQAIQDGIKAQNESKNSEE